MHYTTFILGLNQHTFHYKAIYFTHTLVNMAESYTGFFQHEMVILSIYRTLQKR